MAHIPQKQGGVVIIGSGMAGYGLVRQLRRKDPQIPMTMITADQGEVYSKPRLSVAFAEGLGPEELVQQTAEAAAEKFNLTLMRGVRVDGIVTDTKTITTSVDEIPYDKLVLALGANQIRLPVEAQLPERVYSVNNLNDYRRWRNVIAPGNRVLIMGAGLIGSEFADDLVGAGMTVEVVDPAPMPLGRLLPPALAEKLISALQAKGVSFHMGQTVSHLSEHEGHVLANLSKGHTLEVDHVLSAVGLVPNIQLAEAAGIVVNRGIVVDQQLQTSATDVFAIGDCAETAAGNLPFVLPLMAQAGCLAKTLAGEACQFSLPASPVTVKTKSLPLVVSPPSPESQGVWSVTGEGSNLTALFEGDTQDLLGFALSGEATSQWQKLTRELPPLIASR